MGTYSGNNSEYLNPRFALRTAYEKMDLNLYWLDIIPTFPSTDGSFIYSYNSANKSSDANKMTAPLRAEGTRFTEVEMGAPVTASALTTTNGFQMRMDRTSIRSPIRGKSTILKAYETLGYWISEQRNTESLASITSGANSISACSPAATWDDTSAADPVTDIRNLASDVRAEGYPQRLTDVFVNDTNWEELNQYLMRIDTGDLKQREIFGMPALGADDSIIIPAANRARVRNVFSAITEGYILGMDTRPGMLGVELHYFNDPGFATPKVTYQTILDGKKVNKTVPNPGLHFNFYEEDNTHDVIMQMWSDCKTVVTDNNGIYYGSGI